MPEAKEAPKKPAAEAKPKEDPKVAIPKLLKQLKDATDQGEKRKLRARLRSLGHFGGLPKEDRPPRQPKAKKEEAPVGKDKPAPAVPTRRSRAAAPAA